MSIPRRFMRSAGLPAVFLLCTLILFGCDYARMKEDEALRTYETKIPDMPKRTIPVEGGFEVLRQSDPTTVLNPLPQSQEAVDRGKERYQFYCVQCHGPKADGNGTVGQSFAPLPTNLRSPVVQEQTDGELFYKINLGFNRHPPLLYTVSNEEAWAIIHYLRSLAGQPLS